ncbi:hypothetical protein SAVIM338S_02665 [Streptomyces avidinii]
MQLRGRKRATAAAVAVIGTLLGGSVAVGPPGAFAAPNSPSAPGLAPALDPPPAPSPVPPTAPAPLAGAAPAAGPGADAAPGPVRAADAGPAVWPRPQSMAVDPARDVTLGPEVVLVLPAGADPYAVQAVREALRGAGAHTLHERADGQPMPERIPVVRLQGPDAEQALRELGASGADDLPPGGYRLAVGRAGGRDTVALAGAGEDGLFHAAQTLRQLIVQGAGKVPGVVVRDWPSAPVRGITEGFYGTAWTAGQRLEQVGFMGRTKQNRLLLAPGDDPYRTTDWRRDYPAEQAAELRTLAERARANKVVLAWAVAPGQSMCLSRSADRAALARKVDAMWDLGFRAFQLQFQDVSYSEWGCGADRERYGKGPAAAAKAHAEVAGELAAHLAGRYPGAPALSLLPTEYYQDGATAYRTALAAALDGRVEVAWTGVGVLPRTITGREVAGARSVLGHPLLTMDNYPVNDWDPGRIFLGPYAGRDPAVAGGSAGVLANAMSQGTLSRIPLFTAADFTWNPRGYRPAESWTAAVAELAGPDPKAREALAALAGNTASSGLAQPESAYLAPLVEEFWRTRPGGDPAAGDRLRAAFRVLREAPERLPDLAGEAGPWLSRLARYGAAGELALDVLQAQARGDGAAAWQSARALAGAREALAPEADAVRVDKAVLDPFLARAAAEADAWTGAARQAAGTVSRTSDSWTVQLPAARPVSTVTVMTDPLPPGSRGAAVEAHVPGEGWRKVAEAAASGWTQADLGGLSADAVRLSWSGQAPAVHGVVPWTADGPEARFDVAESVDAEIGGSARPVPAELSALRPGEVRGPLSAAPPPGIEVRVPASAVAPRGAKVTVPVEVAVAAGTAPGTYEVPVTFGAQTRTLKIHAFPRTGGPNLLRGARATSSADETPDFPASGVLDDSPATRWSSPAADGAWWQAELPSPARVGMLRLAWQEAYPSRFRVETSPDGTTWHPSTTVASTGGVDTVRLPSAPPDTKFLRVTCETRATRYGCSLLSAEAFAVTP